jgi:hypothetical protein
VVEREDDRTTWLLCTSVRKGCKRPSELLHKTPKFEKELLWFVHR